MKKISSAGGKNTSQKGSFELNIWREGKGAGLAEKEKKNKKKQEKETQDKASVVSKRLAGS